MAKVIEKEPMTKHTLFLYKGDMDKLQSLSPELGASIVIRRLVRRHIERLEAKLPQLQLGETEL